MPASPARISGHYRIIGQQRDPFHRRLRNQQPVKRILVYGRQRIDGNRVLTKDRQLLVSVIDQAAA